MAEVSTAAPATHRQPSRKGKKAWRKNVDLTEVQHGLEEAREEIIKTGGIIAEAPADQLFALDVTGDENIAQQQSGKKLLKADEILALRSAVPGLEGRKRKAAETDAAPSKRLKNGKYVSHRQLQHLRAVADGAKGVALEEGGATHDPWVVTPVEKNPHLDFLEDAKPTREPKTLKAAPISLAANGRRIPNVSKPDAGKSYNPTEGDYRSLLERVGAAAVAAEEARLAAEAETEAREARALEEAARVEATEQNEYATDYDSAWESEWDGFQSETEQVHTQKLKGRKTPSEASKAKARKQRAQQELHERKMKERERQEKRIAQIAKEISAKDKAGRAHAMALQRGDLASSDSEDGGTDVQLQRRRYGKVPVPDAPLEVVLEDELADSLRRLKPEGNLMQERYRNLLVNGKLEVRKKVWQKKQAKKTRSEKWSYKDWKLR